MIATYNPSTVRATYTAKDGRVVEFQPFMQPDPESVRVTEATHAGITWSVTLRQDGPPLPDDIWDAIEVAARKLARRRIRRWRRKQRMELRRRRGRGACSA